jgi:hypothetical protein
MAIVVTAKVSGLTEEQVRQIPEMMERLGPQLQQSKAFIAHASGLIPGGFRAVEVRHSREDWQQWFDTTVRSTREAGGMPDSERQFFEAPFVFVA